MTTRQAIKVLKRAKQFIVEQNQIYRTYNIGICWAVGYAMGWTNPHSFVDKYCDLPKRRSSGYCWSLTKRGLTARLRHLDKCIANLEKKLKPKKK